MLMRRKRVLLHTRQMAGRRRTGTHRFPLPRPRLKSPLRASLSHRVLAVLFDSNRSASLSTETPWPLPLEWNFVRVVLRVTWPQSFARNLRKVAVDNPDFTSRRSSKIHSTDVNEFIRQEPVSDHRAQCRPPCSAALGQIPDPAVSRRGNSSRFRLRSERKASELFNDFRAMASRQLLKFAHNFWTSARITGLAGFKLHWVPCSTPCS